MDQTPIKITSYDWKPVKRLSKNSKIQKNKTCTPTMSQNSKQNSSILSPYMDLEKNNSKMSTEEYFPSTQAFKTDLNIDNDLNVKEGIGWNYKSPSTIRSKTEMEKILEESASPMQPKPSASYNLAWKARKL